MRDAKKISSLHTFKFTQLEEFSQQPVFDKVANYLSELLKNNSFEEAHKVLIVISLIRIKKNIEIPVFLGPSVQLLLWLLLITYKK